MTTREKTAAAIKKMQDEWNKAPLHIKAMAGKHVEPLIAAITAIDDELAQSSDEGAKDLRGVK